MLANIQLLVEEKHGRAFANGKTGDDDSESSDDETEDEEGFLATEDLDAEISATLQAIKNKDPRIYDEGTTFYRPIDEASVAASKPSKEEKQDFVNCDKVAKILGIKVKKYRPAWARVACETCGWSQAC